LRSSSNSFNVSLTGPDGSLPAWTSGAALNTWFPIPGTANSLINPAPGTYSHGSTGPASKTGAWCSTALQDAGSVIYMHGGGHTNYGGNEVDSIRLADDAPQWVRRRAPTPPAQAPLLVNATRRYADGRVTSSHTYFNTFFINFRGEFVLHQMHAGFAEDGGSGWNNLERFDATVTDDWLPVEQCPTLGGSTNLGMGKAKGPNEDIYWYDSDARWLRTNMSTLATTSTGFQPFGWLGGRPLCWDPIRDRFLRGGPNGGWTLVNRTTGVASPAGESGYTSGTAAMNCSMMWDSIGLRFLILNNAYELWAVDPDTLVASRIMLAGSTPSGPPGLSSEAYNKCHFVAPLKGIIFANRQDENLKYVRLYA
jgi:hypothetical protein